MAKARKEIDKDSMYQKIMPSAMRSVAAPAEETDIPIATPIKKTPAKAAPRKAAAKVSVPIAEEDEALPVQQPVAAPPRKPAAPSVEVARPAIINIMERLINDKIDIAIEKFRCCTCEKCRQDITAMALNKLHPKYIVAEPELLAEGLEDKEANTQVTTALVQAILKVKANPKH